MKKNNNNEIERPKVLYMAKRDNRMEVRVNSYIKQETQKYCQENDISFSDLINNYLLTIVNNDNKIN